MVTILVVVAVTAVGLMVGVELAVAFVLNPVLLRLPAGCSLDARADGGRMLGRAMPFWYVGSLALIGALVAVSWGRPPAIPALIAAVLLAVSVVLSVAWLVPINNRSRTWTAQDHPADCREQHRRWDRLHYGRLALIAAAFVLTVVAGVVG